MKLEGYRMSSRLLTSAVVIWLVLAAGFVATAHVVDPDFDILDDFHGLGHGVRAWVRGLGRAVRHAGHRYGWSPVIGITVVAVGLAVAIDRALRQKHGVLTSSLPRSGSGPEDRR
ncbi:MAG: hypothetical protein U1E76_22300 [Planctomycetota bacterium]